jgi:hypothetical protein
MKKPCRLSWLLAIGLSIGFSTAFPFWGITAPAKKPVLAVEADGLPGGHDTPEGAACDLARSYIKSDEKLFSDICIRPYGGGTGREKYTTFLQATKHLIEQEHTKKTPTPNKPDKIGKVYAARRLSMNGPESLGYAAFNFQELMFVDVGVYDVNGQRELNRTLVIKDKDGKWYAHPNPAITPLLMAGLNQEKPSTLDVSDVYELKHR